MKFHPDVFTAPSIRGYGEGWIQIAEEKISHSVVLSSRGERFDWACDRFEDLTPAHFELLARLRTELVIFGSGRQLRFARPELSRALIEQQIGLETMDTAAACRTYNVLANEGRIVACALLMR